MDRTRPQGRLTAAIVAASIPLLLYVATYLFCPTEERAVGYDRIVYSEWLASLYAPAARLESAIVGNPVNLRYYGGVYEVPSH
jgi:hypothetical protein